MPVAPNKPPGLSLGGYWCLAVTSPLVAPYFSLGASVVLLSPPANAANPGPPTRRKSTERPNTYLGTVSTYNAKVQVVADPNP
ncbi:hypothetical protein V494_00001 [Pseudogymnoascus sp. VKM F-4513 (FW-928)]|nr:hypothetical protein V494_00001 [Pseudogymnoascus sp. VKM F-4513 (FW-928)]